MGNIIIQSSLFPFIQIYRGSTGFSDCSSLYPLHCLQGTTSAVVGFFGSLLQDILCGQSIGICAHEYMLAGYIIGLVYGKVFAR